MVGGFSSSNSSGDWDSELELGRGARASGLYYSSLQIRFCFLVVGGSRAATIACRSRFISAAARVFSRWLLEEGREKEEREKGVPTHLVKNVLQLVLGERAALDVPHGTQLLGHLLAILLPHGRHLLLAQLLAHAGIIAQIGLGADDEARHARAVVVHLGEPLFPDVLEGGGRGDGEADEEDVGLGVRERAQAVVILLSGSIEETEGIWLVADPVEGR